MRRFHACLIVVALAALALVGTSHAAPGSSTPTGGATYFDLLDMHGAPRSPTDRSFNIFFDAGAWHGYSLPPKGDTATGFVGPFVHDLGSGRWTGKRMATLTLTDADTGRAIALKATGGHFAPGYLVRTFTAPGLAVRETLFFIDSFHTRINVRIAASRARTLKVSVGGVVWPTPHARMTTHAGMVVRTFGRFPYKLVTRVASRGANATAATATADGYRLARVAPLALAPGKAQILRIDQMLIPRKDDALQPPAENDDAWAANRARWAGYLESVASSHLAGVPDALARRVAVKAVETLIGNWRAPRGDLHHAGVIPSYSNRDFNGFWAWDSWKHAAALALFAPQLARSQILAMFDYQRADGMVPDCIFIDKANDNWRDTKPPLATWAVMAVWRATHDRSFLATMYPKLVRYHDWWYAKRDHNHDGLAEYGSTDGTKVAAKWESGMDNAVRFDHIRMLKNGPDAWSMNQESADLNAYLYAEDNGLARIAAILGKAHDHAHWMHQAATLKHAIQSRLFDAKAGYFFDRKLNGTWVAVYGSDGWIPLWAGAASPAQAQAVANVMRDPRKFATFMPLPTLARDNPNFAPAKGYWRGPVWLDQALFGVEGLRRYGFTRQADTLAKRLLVNAKGLTGQAPFYENYDPLTGQGYQSRNFSWAAASYLLLLNGGALPGTPTH